MEPAVIWTIMITAYNSGITLSSAAEYFEKTACDEVVRQLKDVNVGAMCIPTHRGRLAASPEVASRQGSPDPVNSDPGE